MPVQQMKIILPGGETLVPAIQFILNATTQIAVLGIPSDFDFTDYGVLADKKTTVEPYCLFEELPEPHKSRLYAAMRNEGWNWLRYSNPKCFLLTQKSKPDGRSIVTPN